MCAKWAKNDEKAAVPGAAVKLAGALAEVDAVALQPPVGLGGLVVRDERNAKVSRNRTIHDVKHLGEPDHVAEPLRVGPLLRGRRVPGMRVGASFGKDYVRSKTALY